MKSLAKQMRSITEIKPLGFNEGLRFEGLFLFIPLHTYFSPKAKIRVRLLHAMRASRPKSFVKSECCSEVLKLNVNGRERKRERERLRSGHTKGRSTEPGPVAHLSEDKPNKMRYLWKSKPPQPGNPSFPCARTNSTCNDRYPPPTTLVPINASIAEGGAVVADANPSFDSNVLHRVL